MKNNIRMILTAVLAAALLNGCGVLPADTAAKAEEPAAILQTETSAASPEPAEETPAQPEEEEESPVLPEGTEESTDLPEETPAPEPGYELIAWPEGVEDELPYVKVTGPGLETVLYAFMNAEGETEFRVFAVKKDDRDKAGFLKADMAPEDGAPAVSVRYDEGFVRDDFPDIPKGKDTEAGGIRCIQVKQKGERVLYAVSGASAGILAVGRDGESGMPVFSTDGITFTVVPNRETGKKEAAEKTKSRHAGTAKETGPSGTEQKTDVPVPEQQPAVPDGQGDWMDDLIDSLMDWNDQQAAAIAGNGTQEDQGDAGTPAQETEPQQEPEPKETHLEAIWHVTKPSVSYIQCGCGATFSHISEWSAHSNETNHGSYSVRRTEEEGWYEYVDVDGP